MINRITLNIKGMTPESALKLSFHMKVATTYIFFCVLGDLLSELVTQFLQQQDRSPDYNETVSLLAHGASAAIMSVTLLLVTKCNLYFAGLATLVAVAAGMLKCEGTLHSYPTYAEAGPL
ncbi:MAG: hypothetical protein P4L10_04770 [Acidobacteriaceae bacterium]|nr:hypothetical protein [Acidobacteriaceae bacterium]